MQMFGGKGFQANRTASAKALGQGWDCSKTSKKLWAWNGAGERGAEGWGGTHMLEGSHAGDTTLL